MQQQKLSGPLATILIGCVAAFGLAGCSGNSASTTTTAPAPDFQGASTATGDEVSASIGSMSMTQSASAGGTLADVRGARSVHPMASGGFFSCGTVVVNATNAAGQVTDETITYTLPACEISGVFGSESLAITGALELVRPDPGVFDFSSTATNLEYAFSANGVTKTETRNGTRSVAATAALLSESNNITTSLTNTGAASGTVVNTLAVAFTPTSGAVLTPTALLPDGTVTVNGGLVWTPTTTGATADSFAVTTTTPLAYDAACAGTSASAFDSGELKLVIADGSVKTYARITWTACGAPVVTVI